MSVTQRGPAWQVYVKRGTQRFRIAAPTEEQGKRWEQEIVDCLDAGKPVDLDDIKSIGKAGSGKTLKDAFDIVQTRRWKGTKAEKSRWLNALAVMEVLGQHTSVDAITDEDVDTMMKAFEDAGNSDATINRKISALSLAVKLAIKRGWRTKALDLERRKEYKGRIRYLVGEEENTLLTATRHFGYTDQADLWVFLIDTGCRISEALRVNPAKDCTATHVSFWKTKNDEARTIPLTERCKEIVHRRRNLPLLFPFDYWTADRAWDRVRSHLKLLQDREWVIHMLRHTCASRLVQRGIPILVVKEWMGHKSIVTTMRYAHLAPSNLDAAVAVLNPASPLGGTVDAWGLKPQGSKGRAGSSPAAGTNVINLKESA